MLVLHVGPHKTATTWLQHNFYHNRKALEGAGWLYPETGERVRVGHHDLSDNAPEILKPGSRKVREIRRIAEKAAARGLNILLSSEGFRNWKPQHIEALQRIVAPHELHIVYCLRDPASLIYSFWAQQVKTGQTLSFPEFEEKHFSRPLKSRILNPGIELKALREIEGARLTVLLYDEIRRSGRDIFDVFCTDVLKIEALPHAPEAAGNDREPIEMTEFMRLVQRRIGNFKEEADVNIGRVFRYMLGSRKRDEIVAAVSAVTAARRSREIDRELPVFTELEKRMLNRYRAHMIPKPGNGTLFLRGNQVCIYYDEETLVADPKVARLLDDTARKFRPGGLRMWVASWSRFWLTLYRRIMKAVKR
jgi:hypothetical protein